MNINELDITGTGGFILTMRNVNLFIITYWDFLLFYINYEECKYIINA